MRDIDDLLESDDDFEYIEKVDKKEEKKKKWKKGYKEIRGIVGTSKVGVRDEKVVEALEKARKDFLESSGVSEKLFGLQNTFFYLLELNVDKVDINEPLKFNSYKDMKDDNIVKNIILQFPESDEEVYDKVNLLAEKHRKRFKLRPKSFGLSNLVYRLVVNELIDQGYLK